MVSRNPPNPWEDTRHALLRELVVSVDGSRGWECSACLRGDVSLSSLAQREESVPSTSREVSVFGRGAKSIPGACDSPKPGSRSTHFQLEPPEKPVRVSENSKAGMMCCS